jgi:hypothetical protein
MEVFFGYELRDNQVGQVGPRERIAQRERLCLLCIDRFLKLEAELCQPLVEDWILFVMLSCRR